MRLKWNTITATPPSPCFVGKWVGESFLWDWAEFVGGCWINHHGSEFVSPTHWHPPLPAPGRNLCELCDSPIEGVSNSTRRFCSDRCSRINRFGHGVCEVCNEEFPILKKSQTCCSVSCGNKAKSPQKIATRRRNEELAYLEGKRITDEILQRELGELTEMLKRK